jgi:hypothetical protein
VVYRGGLENRFGLTANGGSNPSLSAMLAFRLSRVGEQAEAWAGETKILL